VIDAVGVYVIWHEGNPSRVVRVGHGEIRERLHYHQEDPEVLAYSRFGTLRVTWAAVQSDQMEGVERYLVEHWKTTSRRRPAEGGSDCGELSVLGLAAWMPARIAWRVSRSFMYWCHAHGGSAPAASLSLAQSRTRFSSVRVMAASFCRHY
jgi:hypothetical protein